MILAASTFAGGTLASNGSVTGHHDLSDRGDEMHLDAMKMGHFDHLDRNNGGKVSREEIAAHEDASRMPDKMFDDRMGPDR